MASPVVEAPETVLGSTMPRLWTRPLVVGPPGPCGCGCALTRETSYGYAVVDFAALVLREPLDPWQRWFVIHAGELLPDGRPRFATVLLLVARQNGKTEVCKILMLYWMYVECWELMLGTSTKLVYAAETWTKAWKQARRNRKLAAAIPADGVRKTNGEQCFTVVNEVTDPETGEVEEYESRYQIAASNEEGGRSLTIDRLLQDELRHHYNWEAWEATTNAQNARPYAQNFGVSNAGSDRSVVLNSVRDSALTFVEWWDEHGNPQMAELLAAGGRVAAAGDWRLGIFEWSAPEGCDITDPAAQAAANPNLGRRLAYDTIYRAALVAAEKGGKKEANYRTEVLCQRVKTMDAAVDPTKWAASNQPGTLDEVRRRLAAVFDVSPDGQHATLAVAGVVGEQIRVEIVDAWSGPDCVTKATAELPALLARVKPRIFGWYPGGPAAAATVDLGKTRRPGWPVRGVRIEEIKTDTAAVCMGFAALVIGDKVLHSGDALADAHVLGAEKLYTTGARWVFSRKGEGHCDAAYAEAGAAHLARTLPAAVSASVPTSSMVRDELARMRAERARADSPPTRN